MIENKRCPQCGTLMGVNVDSGKYYCPVVPEVCGYTEDLDKWDRLKGIYEKSQNSLNLTLHEDCIRHDLYTGILLVMDLLDGTDMANSKRINETSSAVSKKIRETINCKCGKIIEKKWHFSANWGEEWNMEFKWYPTFHWDDKQRCAHLFWGFIGWER